MPGRQAKLISDSVLQRMLAHVRRHSPTPARDRVMILLSVRAGLRAAEIAKLTWRMVLDARGRVGDMLVVTDRIAKKRGGRRIPLHADLRAALVGLWRSTVNCRRPDRAVPARRGDETQQHRQLVCCAVCRVGC